MATCSKTRVTGWFPTMINWVGRLIYLICPLILAGCTLGIPKPGALKSLWPFKSADQKALEAFAWSLSVAGTEYRVYAMKVEGRTVYFRNDFNMRLTWNGESFVSIENMPGGFGRYASGRELTAQGQEQRWYAQDAVPVRRARCTPAAAWRLSEDRFGWRQTCRGDVDGVSVESSHVVEYDSNSMIREIEASVFPGGPRLILRRLNP